MLPLSIRSLVAADRKTVNALDHWLLRAQTRPLGCIQLHPPHRHQSVCVSGRPEQCAGQERSRPHLCVPVISLRGPPGVSNCLCTRVRGLLPLLREKMRPLALLYNRLKLINPLMQHGCGVGAVCEQIGSKKRKKKKRRRDESKQRLAPPTPTTQREKWSVGAASAGGRPLCVPEAFPGLRSTAWAGGKSREEMHWDAPPPDPHPLLFS